MFERLSEGFSNALRRLSGQATITEDNVRDAMQDVRTALLDADVHRDVVEQFCSSVMKDAVGLDVTKSLRPGQEMIGIVYKRLVEVLGGDANAAPSLGLTPDGTIPKVAPPPTIVMMCGLQGSGKTTTCGKLAAYLKKRGRSVMLAAADLQRPAAVEQLQTVARQVQDEMPGSAMVHCYAEPEKVAEYGKAIGVAVGVCQRALAAAIKAGVDTLILDTAGRLHVNDDLMNELQAVRKLLNPHQIFFVVDSMTGQDAVNSAKAFHEKLEFDGVIMTKFDSETRGGAALSVKHVSGASIRFVGVGEKLDAIEEFHADRFASRILGMGDVLSLVEKAQTEVSEREAQEMQAKLEKGELTLDDFLKQMKTLRRMGPMKQLLGLLPGVGSALKDINIDEGQLDRVEAMIHSMTVKERKKPSVIDHPRRRRIASGSGTEQAAVGQLVKQFETASKMTKQMAALSASGRMKAMASGGAAPDMSQLRLKGSSHTSSIKDRFKKRKK
ncbi:MAG: signal recognition particle protein [Phycisphaerales bacterium]